MNFEIMSFISQSIITFTANLLNFLFYKNIYGCKYEKKDIILLDILLQFC